MGEFRMEGSSAVSIDVKGGGNDSPGEIAGIQGKLRIFWIRETAKKCFFMIFFPLTPLPPPKVQQNGPYPEKFQLSLWKLSYQI